MSCSAGCFDSRVGGSDLVDRTSKHVGVRCRLDAEVPGDRAMVSSGQIGHATRADALESSFEDQLNAGGLGRPFGALVGMGKAFVRFTRAENAGRVR